MGYQRSADVCLIRHRQAGAARRAAEIVDAANDADSPNHRSQLSMPETGGQHPTQAFADLAAIYRSVGRKLHISVKGLTILMVVDPYYSWTVNFLCHLLGKFVHASNRGSSFRLILTFSRSPEAQLPKAEGGRVLCTARLPDSIAGGRCHRHD